MAKKLEDLLVYQKAKAFCDSVDAVLQRPAYRRYRKLAEQTTDASDSITANIGEGFEQGTDAAFAHYLFIAKGSLGEVMTRLRQAQRKRCITQEELDQRLKAGASLSRSLGAFIRYLDDCDYKDRGRYKSRQRRQGREGDESGAANQSGPWTDSERGTDPGAGTTGDQGPRDQGPLIMIAPCPEP